MPEHSGTVLISTHDLKVAGPLRDAFRKAGYRVELVTPDEDLSGVEEPRLFILTGGLKNESAATQARQARLARQIPVFGIAREGEEGTRKVARALDLQEVFSHPPDPREILLLGRTLIERKRLQEITGIVGETDSIHEALERVVQFAPVNATVLVTGESGTGKELIARGIHALSPRRHQAFIAVNLAALSETLLESELFGHEKGAFTGAIDSRRGLFELAQGGVIFLDEIGEMPRPAQTKLLRVLEEREFFRVGGEKTIRVDVRIIAASNQDLRHQVEGGEFRRDLYFRLNVLRIELPPLRDRKEDIPLLVDEFIRDASARHDRRFAGISKDAMRILTSHVWPGNVRELRNLVESMVILAPGRRIEARDIPAEVRNPQSRGLLPVPLFQNVLPMSQASDGSFRPELEFVFRTLVNLRMDVDDLRRDFERYQQNQLRGQEVPFLPPDEILDDGQLQEVFPEPADLPGVDSHPPAEWLPDDGIVVYRAGMTMEDMEKEAIRAVLDESGGNRRKAAERLGIGERTLYRKIKKYGLDE
jgi:transcriptional regulator with PAS, ATPase and Fis domain